MERNAGNDGRQPMLVPGTHEKYSDAEQETLPRRNTVDLDEDRNRKIENIKERRNKREGKILIASSSVTRNLKKDRLTKECENGSIELHQFNGKKSTIHHEVHASAC